MFEMLDLTALTLFTVAAVAVPWYAGDAVILLRSGYRSRGALVAAFAILWLAVAVYLGFRIPVFLRLFDAIPRLPFLWHILSSNI